MVTEIFQKPKPVLGTVQLLPLPGSAGWDGHLEAVLARAEQEASALASGGVDGILLENTGDVPYRTDRIDVAGAVAMGLIARRVMQLTHLPVGISVLQNDPETALSVAVTTGAAFIRVPLLLGAMVTESGLVEGRLTRLLEAMQTLKASTKVLVDISPRHMLGERAADMEAHLLNLARAAERQSIVHWLLVGDDEVEPATLEHLKREIDKPVLAVCRARQSYEPELLKTYYESADGLILESGIRKATAYGVQGVPSIDMHKVEELVNDLKNIPHILDTLDPEFFLQP